MSIDKKINPEEILSIINNHKIKWVMDRVYVEVDKDCIKIIEEYGQQEFERGRTMPITIDSYLQSLTKEQLLKNIDWEEVYRKQFGSRDSIYARISNNGKLIIDWSNDNGWGLITAQGSETLMLENRLLTFVPKPEVISLLLPAPPQQGKE